MNMLECQPSTNINVAELNALREKIEGMSKFNQVEILRLLNKHKTVTLNENKYGIHINLSELSSEVIEELKIHINYVNDQEMNLNEMEQQKETLQTKYFTKDNKDTSTKNKVEPKPKKNGKQ
jgi:hypothetical protein